MKKNNYFLKFKFLIFYTGHVRHQIGSIFIPKCSSHRDEQRDISFN